MTIRVEDPTANVAAFSAMRSALKVLPTTLETLRRLRVSDLPALHASPPAVTVATSSQISSGVFVAPGGSQISYGHSNVALKTGSNPDLWRARAVTRDSSGDIRGNLFSLRFLTDASSFELKVLNNSSRWPEVYVDGQPIRRGRVKGMTNDFAVSYIKYDFGADEQTRDLNLVLSNGGTGYVAGEIVTIAGGTGTPTQIKVLRVASGVIADFDYVDSGSYSALPASPVSQASTTGAGTGAAFTYTATANGTKHTTRQTRHIEVFFDGLAEYYGMYVPPLSVVRPWPVPAGVRAMVFGDSYTANSNATRQTGGYAFQALQRLGVDDRWLSGVPNQGYLALGGNNTFRDRINDIITYAPTDPNIAHLVIVAGGINDRNANAAALEAEVTLFAAALTAALPSAFIVFLGPFRSPALSPPQAIFDAVQNGVAAGSASHAHTKYIDLYAEAWQSNGGYAGSPTGTGNSDFWIDTDLAHPHQAGHDWLGYLVANRVEQAISQWVS